MRRRRLLFSDIDRNVASPTESAAGKRKQREHSGADRLKPGQCGWESRSVRRVHVTRQEWKSRKRFARETQDICFSMRVVPRIMKIVRPGIQQRIPGLFVWMKIIGKAAPESETEVSRPREGHAGRETAGNEKEWRK